MTINVAFVACGGIETASSRLRALLPAENLSKIDGFKASCTNDILKAVAMRPDCIVLQRIYGASVNRILSAMDRKARVILDLCDYYYDAVPTMNQVDIITTATPTRMQAFKSKHPKLKILVVQDEIDYHYSGVVTGQHWGEAPARVGWFGTYSNIDVLKMIPASIQGLVFGHLSVQNNIPSGWTFQKWDYWQFASQARTCPVFVLPQTDPGKSPNKLLSLIRLGVPAAVSDIPAYRRILEPVGLGEFLCRIPKDWTRACEALRDPQTRTEYLQATAPIVGNAIRNNVCAQAWAEVIREALK